MPLVRVSNGGCGIGSYRVYYGGLLGSWRTEALNLKAPYYGFMICTNDGNMPAYYGVFKDYQLWYSSGLVITGVNSDGIITGEPYTAYSSRLNVIMCEFGE